MSLKRKVGRLLRCAGSWSCRRGLPFKDNDSCCMLAASCARTRPACSKAAASKTIGGSMARGPEVKQDALRFRSRIGKRIGTAGASGIRQIERIGLWHERAL